MKIVQRFCDLSEQQTLTTLISYKELEVKSEIYINLAHIPDLQVINV